jgi:MFS family permease
MPLNLADREWNWIDDGVLPYALNAMRAVWVWFIFHLLARGLTPTRGDSLAPPVVFGLLAASTLLAQYGAFRAKNGMRATWLIALSGLGAGALALYLGVGADRFALWDARWLGALYADPALAIVVLVVAVWLWRWGILTGREPLTYDNFSSDFAVGIIVFLFALAIAYATAVVPLVELLLPVLVFFAVGLGTLAIASVQSTRRFERGRTGLSVGLNRYWLGTVAIVVGGLIVGGLILTQFFAPEMFMGILSTLAVVFNLIARLLFWVLVVVAFVVFSILEFFAHFFPEGNPPPETSPLQMPPHFAEQLKDLEQRPASLSPEIYLIFQILAGALIGAFIILIFALAFRRFKTLLEEDVEEMHETIFSFDLLKEQLARLFQRTSPAQDSEQPPFVLIDGDDPRAQIRRTYQAVLAWATARAMPRAPGMTPNEYLRFMNQALPQHGELLSVITAAYLQARYCPAPVSVARAEEVARAWEMIVRGNAADKVSVA